MPIQTRDWRFLLFVASYSDHQQIIRYLLSGGRVSSIKLFNAQPALTISSTSFCSYVLYESRYKQRLFL